MTDTYLIWKLISLVNFIYIAFVCKAKTDQLTMVCNIYTNIYLQAFKNQSTNTLSTITLHHGLTRVAYVFTPAWWRGSLCFFFGSLSYLVDIVLSFILLVLYRQTFPTRIFFLLDVEISNLFCLRNFDLYMFYIEFILEKVSKMTKHKSCAIKKIEPWYNVIKFIIIIIIIIIIMTDTYLIWKLISLVNFIYIAFVCKGKTGQLTMVCTIYTNIYLQAFKNQSTNTLSTITLYQYIVISIHKKI
jgi:uncharacterized protein YnzC (UPF0291/DUF896 family)